MSLMLLYHTLLFSTTKKTRSHRTCSRRILCRCLLPRADRLRRGPEDQLPVVPVHHHPGPFLDLLHPDTFLGLDVRVEPWADFEIELERSERRQKKRAETENHLSTVGPEFFFPLFIPFILFPLFHQIDEVSDLVLDLARIPLDEQNPEREEEARSPERIPKKTTIAMAMPKGRSLKICSIYHSIPISVPSLRQQGSTFAWLSSNLFPQFFIDLDESDRHRNRSVPRNNYPCRLASV